MRSPKGLILPAALALLMIAPAWGACPDGPDCVWVDDDACGACVSDGRDCGTGSDCPPGICVGAGSDVVAGTGCEIGGAACTGDQFCLDNGWGFCLGLCEGTTQACYGNSGCAVCTDGTAGFGTQAEPYCTFNQAYQFAADGDTIYVGPGTYKQCADLFGAELPVPQDRAVHVLARAFDESDEDVTTIGDTTIDGTGICQDIPVMTLFGSGASVTGMTVMGGGESGLFVSGSVAITSNRITGNSATVGGGIFIDPGSCYYDGIATISVTDNEITGNAAAAGTPPALDVSSGHGGGIGVLVIEETPGFPDGCGSDVDVDIRDNIIWGNSIENRNTDEDGIRYIARGGGVYVATAMEEGGTVNVRIVDNNVFSNGRTTGTLASAGGGIFVLTDLAGFGAESIVVEGNTVGPNNQAHEGGGIAAWASTFRSGQHSISVEKNQIMGNTAVSTSAEGAGGGVSLRVEAIDLNAGDSVALRFSQNDVSGNTADASDGGGIRASFLSERSVSETLGSNTSPADEMSLVIEDNTIRNNTSNVGGAGALLLVLSDSDPEFQLTENCVPALQSPANATIEFNRNLVSGNRANNILGFTEVGAGILTIPSTYGEAEARVLIEGSTLAGNTIGENFQSSGGLETLPFADADCDGTLDAKIEIAVDRSIVDGNDGYGVGGTLLDIGVPAGSLVLPVTNSYLFGNAAGNFEPALYPAPPPSNSQADPQLTRAFAPSACSPVFDVRVCEGTTTPCIDSMNCPIGVECLVGVGFHGSPDVAPDFLIDGLDILDLAVSFNSTDTLGPRFSEVSDLDHNGVVDGEDLSYMCSQFGQVCQP